MTFFSILIFAYPCPSSRLRFPLCNFSIKCEPGNGDNELQETSETIVEKVAAVDHIPKYPYSLQYVFVNDAIMILWLLGAESNT